MAIKDKVVVITGASSGIGAATAMALAKQGAKLVLGARRNDRLEELEADIQKIGGEVTIQQTDVAKDADVKKLITTAENVYHKVDVLFNNAGLMPLSPLHEGRLSDWDQMIDVNLKGVLHGIKNVLPIMKKQGYGQIIATDSVAGHVVTPNSAVYSATKFAVKALMEGLRQEEGKNNIKTTLISPGAVLTELANTIPDKETRAKTLEKETELGLTADDIANAVIYAIDQPKNVDVNEVLIRPTQQFN